MTVDEKKLACWTNGVDTAVASDAAEARVIVADMLGDHVEDVSPMRRIEDDKVLTILNENTGESITKTAGEWAQSNGRGFLCSSEW